MREATAPTDEGANSGQSVCELARSEYAALRDAGNQCREDADCAEIYPGTCPQGPYYVNVAGDHAAISAAAAAMRVACGDVECEPPLSLGIARCAAGRCESGPRPAEPGCTDTRVTYMDGGRPTIGESHPTRGLGGGPLHAVGVPRSGTLRLTATVSGEDRQPWVAALQSTSVVPIDGTDFMPEADAMGTVRPVPSGAPGSRARRVHREFTVEPGVYLVGTRGAPGEVRYEAGLRDEHGKPMAVDRRGVVHLRSCEQ
ncbi:MAG: hypothetical protein AAF799_00805 [Myxococcota bacterium]